MALNAAITFAGIILLGFIYSFSQNQLHNGVEIEPIIPNTSSQPILAKDIASPVKNTKKKLSVTKGTNNKLSFFDFFNLTIVNKKTIKKNLDK